MVSECKIVLGKKCQTTEVHLVYEIHVTSVDQRIRVKARIAFLALQHFTEFSV